MVKSWLYNYKLLFDNSKSINNLCLIMLVFSFILFISEYKKYSLLFFYLFIFFTILSYYDQGENNKENNENKEKCRMPTVDNPMANVMPLDPESHIETCKNIPQEVYDKYLYDNLIEKVDDTKIRDRLKFMYTMPVTSFPQNTEKTLEFLYERVPSCKSDGVNCQSYTDLRFK